MRDFLNGILAAIGSTSLTDAEFLTVTAQTQSYNQATYDDLSAILVTRESVSTLQDRLFYYFKARGAEISQAETGKSNIFIGAVLE